MNSLDQWKYFKKQKILITYRIFGSDFSPSAIELSNLVHKSSPYKNTNGSIQYLVDDILNSSFQDSFFDCIYDKGTFDSLSLVGSQFLEDEGLSSRNV